MIDPVRELKVRAEILHHAVHADDLHAIERLRGLDEFRHAEHNVLRQAAKTMQRKHCLAVVARETGFATWDHARRIFEGDRAESDFGTLLYGGNAGTRLHPWFASHDEARAALRAGDGSAERRYLLAYKRHFFIANPSFIREALGCDPLDADWESIGWDWAEPRDLDARRRLYGKVISAKRSDVVSAPGRRVAS